MTKLSVNINKVATLRNARGGNLPDVQRFAVDCELFGAQGITVHPRPDERHIRHLIDVLGIGDRLSHLPGAMSGGQQQRVCIARALANKPSILFADEPTGNLDARTGEEVLYLMRSVAKELGITLILVTHDMGVAEASERIIRLEDGQVAEDSWSGGMAP